MRKTMLGVAMGLMKEGIIPSISDVAEAAQVSRATAYRYFPTQSALIQAAVAEALGPILQWSSESVEAGQRVAELISFGYPRIDYFETTLRAALRLALDQWARRQAGKLGTETPLVRGNRIGLLNSAVAPLRRSLSRSRVERLVQALSLVFGTEAFVVLKDIWGLDLKQAQEVALWTCQALVQTAISDAGLARRRETRGSRGRGTPRRGPGDGRDRPGQVAEKRREQARMRSAAQRDARHIKTDRRAAREHATTRTGRAVVFQRPAGGIKK
jgi:AcrR family transcriptional regulator